MDPLYLVILIVLLGLLFDYTNGFHDAANVVSTVIATRVLAPLTAIVLAGVLNAIGATQISGVAKTITSGLVDGHVVTQVMVLCAVGGAIGWNILTWYYGIPSSSSYALVGGLVGAAIFKGGFSVVFWQGVLYKVILPMVISPLMGCVLGLLLMKLLHLLLRKGLFGGRASIFRHLQIGSASLVALAHGFNDAQKSMAVITLGLFSAGFLSELHIPLWVILACALMMGIGTASGGMRIIRTVGYKITPLVPLQGFAAESSASMVILAASFLGMPLSSTHMIVGSVTGVGMAKGKSAVSWTTMQKMAIAWVLTLPGSALVAMGIYWGISCVF